MHTSVYRYTAKHSKVLTDGMHAILCSRFDVVKVLPLHEVERATAVAMIRYGCPIC